MTPQQGSDIALTIQGAGFRLEDIPAREEEILQVLHREFHRHGLRRPQRIAPVTQAVEYEEWDEAWHVHLGNRTVEEISAWHIACEGGDGASHYEYDGRAVYRRGAAH